MSIVTVDSLREHLQWAMAVELALIPPYLYAMYSICDENSEAYKLIRSVAAEEMLHAVLDANLLVAIGGDPQFYGATHCPDFPTAMPHHKPELVLHLEALNSEVLDRFLTIEQPKDMVPADDHDEDDWSDVYSTQGQFYLAIEHAIEKLEAVHDIFDSPQLDRQMSNPSFYAPVEYDAEDSGGLEPITDLESAKRAIDIVIHQGEGLHEEHWADPDELELTHYFKFREIAVGAVRTGDVWPLAKNPKTRDFEPRLQPVSQLANAAYSYLFALLDEIYQPMSDDARGELVGRLYTIMVQVLGPVARYLCTQPIRPGAAEHAGPTFEFYTFDTPQTAFAELGELARAVCGDVAELAGVPEALTA